MRVVRCAALVVLCLGFVTGALAQAPTNVAASSAGGKVTVSSQDAGDFCSPAALIDGKSGPNELKCWASSANATLPQWVEVTPGGGPCLVDTVVIDHYNGPKDLVGDRWPRDVTVFVRPKAGADLVQVAKATLDGTPAPKTIKFTATTAESVRIVVDSIQGRGVVVELSEVSVLAAPAPPTIGPGPTPPPTTGTETTPPPTTGTGTAPPPTTGTETTPPPTTGTGTTPPPTTGTETTPPPTTGTGTTPPPTTGTETTPPPTTGTGTTPPPTTGTETTPPPTTGTETTPPPTTGTGTTPPPTTGTETTPPPTTGTGTTPPPTTGTGTTPPPTTGTGTTPPPTTGSADLPAGVPAGSVDLALASSGGRVSCPTRLEAYFGSERLCDGVLAAGPNGECWVSASGPTYPYDITVSFPKDATYTISAVSITSNTGTPLIFGSRWPRDVEVLVSSTGTLPTDFTSVARTELQKVPDRQTVTFTAVPARYLMVRIHSNWGHTNWLEMTELEAWGDPKSASGGSAIAPPAGGGPAPTATTGAVPRKPDGTIDTEKLVPMLENLLKQMEQQKALIDEVLKGLKG